MNDRVSTYPNRWKLTPVTGQSNVYDLERADDPTVAGTPLNKATFLPDATASAVEAATGASDVVLPADAFNAIASALNTLGLTNNAKINVISYTGTGGTGTITTTFSIHPRAVFYMKSNARFGGDGALEWIYNTTAGRNSITFSYDETNKKLSRSCSSSTDKAIKLCNVSGAQYYIVAIGVK